MIAVYLRDRGKDRVVEFDGREITVGAHGELKLFSADVAAHHCTLLPRAAGCFVAAVAETRVNGKVITEMRVLYRDDRVEIGEAVMFVEHLDAERDPLETQLLLEIRRGDLAARMVYADWLDENGDPRRAEFLRIEDALVEDRGRDDLLRRRRELAMVIDGEWRMQITRARVERCDWLDCRMEWSQLETTADQDRRKCGECHKHVRYCDSFAAISVPSGAERQRIVVDATVRRDFEGETTPSRS